MSPDPALVTARGAKERGPSNLLSSRSFPLWFPILGSFMAWGANLVLGDLINELGCSPGVRGHELFGLSLEVVNLLQCVVTAAVTVVGFVLALRAWRRLQAMSDGTSWERSHALALAGMASSLISFMVIVYGAVTHVFLQGCATALTS